MAIYKILEEIITEKGLSVADVAKICNLPDSTVRGIFRRKQETIALEVAFKISNGLGVSLEKLNGMPEKELLPNEEKSTGTGESALEEFSDREQDHIKKYRSLDQYGKEAVDGVLDVEFRRCEAARATALREQRGQLEAGRMLEPEKIIYFRVPEYTMPMSAGTGVEARQELPQDLQLIKAPPRGTSYIAHVSGNSMEPTYHHGDMVFVHSCEEIPIGKIGVFYMDGKQWIKELGNGELISHNPDYGPIPMREDIRCQGLVLGVCDESYFE